MPPLESREKNTPYMNFLTVFLIREVIYQCDLLEVLLEFVEAVDLKRHPNL